MRFLMTANRGPGHVEPLVPFARAFMRAGHDVLLAAPGLARPEAERAGLAFHALADRDEAEADAAVASLSELPPDERSARFVQEIFAGVNVRASLPGLLELVPRFRPDVVLRETTEIAGLLAAERHGVPHGRVAIMAGATETWGVPVATPAIDRHRRALGLPPEPTGRAVHDSPYLTILPDAMEDPDDVGPAHALRFREPTPAATPLPAWWGDDRRPLVYATFGSVTPRLPFFGELFAATAAELAAVPARVLLTIGLEVDRAELGPVPANVHVERWVAQGAVMPHAAAVVSHGGAGSTRLALAARVPSVVMPSFADQPRNGERLAALGAGIALPDGPAGLATAVRRVLGEPSFAAVARRVQAQIAALPPVDEAPAALADQLVLARAA
jgi:UDP:flavonoid glycosyltransferase YjiC (YdhE family)